MSSSFDMSGIRGSLQRLRPLVKKNARELITTAAKGFVKDVVAITPPASKGVSGSAAKKAGEATIEMDTALTMEAMSDRELSAQQQFHGGTSFAANELKTKKGKVYLTDTNHILWSAAQALAFHLKKRSQSTGRPPDARKGRGPGGKRMRMREAGAHNAHVGRWVADDIALVPRNVFAQVRVLLKKRVGELAAGWNAAATKLGVRLPAWVRRHGDSRGSASVTVGASTIRIVVENAVKFVGNVKGYERRVQKAIDYQARKMDRQADYLLKKALRAAGF